MVAGSVAIPDNWQLRFDRLARIKAALLAAAFLAVFWEQLDFNPSGGLGEIVHRWVHESDWTHGPIIPLFSAYLIYLRWEEIKRITIRHTWIGLVIMLLALALYEYAHWGILFGYVRPMAMLLCLLGMIIFLYGVAIMRYAWLPWLYLFFAIPIP